MVGLMRYQIISEIIEEESALYASLRMYLPITTMKRTADRVNAALGIEGGIISSSSAVAHARREAGTMRL